MEEVLSPLQELASELFSPDSVHKAQITVEGQTQERETQEPKNKRKKKHVKEACVRCKSWHKKCNGEFPCDNCTNKKLECSYAEQRRRGPSTTSLAHNYLEPSSQYQQTIEKLKSEVEYYKNQAYFSNMQLTIRFMNQ